MSIDTKSWCCCCPLTQSPGVVVVAHCDNFFASCCPLTQDLVLLLSCETKYPSTIVFQMHSFCGCCCELATPLLLQEIQLLLSSNYMTAFFCCCPHLLTFCQAGWQAGYTGFLTFSCQDTMPGGLVRAPLTTFRLLLLSQRSHLEPRSFKRLMSVIEGKTVSSFLLFLTQFQKHFLHKSFPTVPVQ